MTAGVVISSPAGGQAASLAPRRGLTTLTQGLLICGVASVLHYLAMLVVVPLAWPAYDSVSQTVSELSAIGAPSRELWNALGRLWSALYLAFGVGVWVTAGSNRALRVVGAAIVLATIVGTFWPPMHRREVLAAGGGTETDTLHLVWTAMNGLLTILAMGFGAAALGRAFRMYSLATMGILLVTGAITAIQSRGLSDNLPTPWLGAWERANMGAWLLWVMVLAFDLLWRLLHQHAAHLARHLPRPAHVHP